MRLSASRLCYVVLMAAAAFGSAQAQIDQDVGALVLFDKRDFVTIEGFQILAGKPFKTEVVRGDTVIGAAWSVGSGGEVAAEVNHPGGECWGADDKRPAGADAVPASLKVTPDMKAGDLVQVRDQNGRVLGGHKVLDASITKTYADAVSTFIVEGKIGTGVSHAFLECRIIQPDWVDTFGRRDARALPGGVVPSDKGGYQSGMDINDAGDFVATFIFNEATDRDLAVNGGGARIMAWMDEDADANRLGLTIHEFGEPGGPGMGGCPAGPNDLNAPQGNFAAKRDGDIVTFSWSKPEVAADASKLVGYYMAAMEQPSTAVERAEVGKRVMNADTVKGTVTVAAGKTYDYEMRSITEAGSFSKAFAALRTGTTGPPGGGGTPPPPLVAKLNGNVVTFEAVDGSAVTFGAGGSLELWYTISTTEDGNPVSVGGDTVAPDALKYTKPITLDVTEGTRYIHWTVFSSDNLHKTDTAMLAVAGAPPIEKPPTLEPAVVGQASLTVKWSTTDANIATFDLQVFEAATGGELIMTELKLAKSLRNFKVTGLTAGKDYWFTVRGVNAANKPSEYASPRMGPAAPTAVTDKITISAAGRWRAGKDFRADGTITAAGPDITVRLCRGGTDPVTKAFTCTTIAGAAAIPTVAGIAPASATWSIRMSNGAVPGAVNPMYAISSKGGMAGPVTLAGRRLRRAM